jgi:hypothetical protein
MSALAVDAMAHVGVADYAILLLSVAALCVGRRADLPPVGRIAVFVTPIWVSGALRMPVTTFLAWNALAALLSTCIAALSAYGIGAAVLGQLSVRRGAIALAVAALALTALAIAVLRHHRSLPNREQE